MSDEIPRLDTTAIIRRFAAGDNVALDEYIARYRGKFVRTANRLIHKLGIDTASLDGEGAVNMALVELWQMRERGLLRPIQDSDDILKLMNVILERLIRHEYRRSKATKRGGGGTSQAGHAAGRRDLKAGEKGGAHQGYLRIDADLDQLISGQPPFVDVVLGKIEFEAFLEELSDEGLRTIFKMRYAGGSVKDIARRLGVVVRPVERKLARIQSIYTESHLEP
jgi:DNA-directed RNA polymerase specialized sigma24 family protein